MEKRPLSKRLKAKKKDNNREELQKQIEDEIKIEAKNNLSKEVTLSQSEKEKIKRKLQEGRIFNLNRDAERYALIDLDIKTNMWVFILVHLPDDKTLKIYFKESGQVSCSCMDFRMRGFSNKFNCKHILYVLSRILKLELNFAKDNSVSSWPRFKESLENVRFDYFNKNPKAKILIVDETKVFEEGDCCPICYIDLDENDRVSLVSCQKCKGVVHIDCMKCWLKHSLNKGCVYCRDEQIGKIFSKIF